LGTEELTTTHNTHTNERDNMSNPYELRFRLLEMAQGYLQDEYSRKENIAIDAWNFAQEQGDATTGLRKELQPESYTIEDIKSKATELYEFVEKQ
jgi:hypothetical protein